MIHLTTSLASSIFFLSLAWAAPSPSRALTGVSIPLTSSRTAGIRNGAYADAVAAKYALQLSNHQAASGQLHPLAKRDFVANASQSVPLTEQLGGLLWTGPITIGSNSQGPFIMDWDTGSSDLWVPSSACNTTACASLHKYDPNSSTTSTLLPGNFTITYEDGSTTSGPEYSDDVTAGGLTATAQAFAAATTITTGPNITVPRDGIVGLAWQGLSQLNATPFFNTLLEQGQVPTAQFSLALRNESDSAFSELYLGGINQSWYTGGITWAPMLYNNTFWVVNGTLQGSDAAASGGRVDIESLTNLKGIPVIVDSGTSQMVGGPFQVEAFYSALGAEPCYDTSTDCGSPGYYLFPCSSPPTVELVFEGTTFDISKYHNLGPDPVNATQCVGAFTSSRDLPFEDAIVVGDTLFQSAYIVFDVDAEAVGFAHYA